MTRRRPPCPPRVVHRLRQGRLVTACLAAVCLTVACVAVGCGRRAEVSGVVTLDGKPLPAGVVTFSPANAGPSGYGAIAADGSYTVQLGSSQGLPPGEYVVTVAANAAAAAGGTPGPGPLSDAITPLMTPQRYADPALSPLRATLKSGTQQLPLVLRSE